jgi:hypothetical protein
MAIKIDKSITLGVRQWAAIGQLAVRLIRADASKGVFQTDEPHKNTYSFLYALMKWKGFYFPAEKIKGQSRKDFVNAMMSKGKKIRPEQYKGLALNTNVSFVDMNLTGQTLRGLKIRAIDETSVTIGYETKDADKIIGNARPHLNRVLVGLNDKNHNLITDLIFDIISDRLIQNLGGDEIISLDI